MALAIFAQSINLVLNIEVNSDASVYDRYYHDLVTEVTSNPDLSKVVTTVGP